MNLNLMDFHGFSRITRLGARIINQVEGGLEILYLWVRGDATTGERRVGSMTSFTLSLFRDDAAREALPAAPRIVYVTNGLCALEGDGTAAQLAPGSAWFGTSGVSLAAARPDSEWLRFELSREGAEGALLARDIALDDAAEYLFRLDTVELPPGGIAYTHTHQGPGIRYLLAGGFNVKVGGTTTPIAPGEAWFEAGPDPVRAWAPDDRIGYFARAMVLPRALKGKSSIRYVDDADRDKPRLQKYSVLVDQFIDL